MQFNCQPSRQRTDPHHENYQKHRDNFARGLFDHRWPLGFGVNSGRAIFLLYIVALAAGILILIGK